MEAIESLWTFQESTEELKEKLQYMTYELEMTRKEANEEMKKNNEHIRKLLQLLQTACKERDEAKTQLKKLQHLLSFNKPSNFDHHQLVPLTAPFSPDSPLLTNLQCRANSGLTESNSFSLETHNTTTNNYNQGSQSQSHVSSPVVDSSPDSSNTTTNNNSNMNNNNIGFSGNTFATTNTPITKVNAVDQGTLAIENMAKGRPLPQKGKLLQAVIEAGPLLQTLMVAGSLPRWRNPPGTLTHQIPPVNIKACASSSSNTSASNTCYVKGFGGGNSSSIYGQLSCSGSIGVSPNSVLDFGSGSSGSCLMSGSGRLMNMPSAVNFDSQFSKRQRLL